MRVVCACGVCEPPVCVCLCASVCVRDVFACVCVCVCAPLCVRVCVCRACVSCVCVVCECVVCECVCVYV